MKTITAPATQAVYHDFLAAPDTYRPIKRMFAAVALDSVLDRRRLEAAIRAVVGAHEILRTCPVTVDGQVLQEIRELREIDEPLLVTTDWDGSAEAVTTLKTGLENWWADPRQLVIRPILATSRSGRSYLLCAYNGCCMDGISAHFLLDQIRAHYSGRPILTAPVQFTDYSAAMTEEGHALAYDDWMRLIDRSASVLPDAIAKDRDGTPQAWIRVLPFALPAEVTAAVGTLCRTFGCTRFEALAVATELYFRRDDDRPASVGVLHGGRRGPRSLDVAGLLRTQVMDVVQIDGAPSAGEAFTAQLGSLRAALRHLARLPVEEVCRRAGLPGGFRFGERRLWEVSIISRFSRFLTGPFGEAAIEPLDAPMQDDWYCENGGPVFSVNFSLGKGAMTGGLQYVDPPVDPDTAAAVVAGLQQTAVRVAADPAAPLASAPAFLRLVP